MSDMDSHSSDTSAENARLAALQELEILDTPPEQDYDDLTELAAYICGTPVSLISLIGDKHQFFKSAHNFARKETPRDQSFCAHMIGTGRTLVVPDARQEIRFAENPLVIGDPKIRFYAGAPILSEEHVLGALCVIDSKPRELTVEQVRALESLARQVSSLLRARLIAKRNETLEHAANEARAAAEEARERLQISIEAGGQAVWFYDPKRNVVGGDELMRKLFGLSIPEGPAELWRASIVEEDRARVHEEFAASLTGAIYDTKYRVAVDGKTRWLHARAKLSPSADGSARVLGVCEDVTREENLAADLERTRYRLAVAQEASGAVSFDWNALLDELTWNSEVVLGRPAKELNNAGAYFAHVCEADRPVIQTAIQAALRDGVGYYIEHRMYWPDGSVHWVSSAAKPLKNSSGVIDSILGVNLDVTERRQSEEALLHTEKLAAVGRLASVISHEINNPLEAVTNLLFIVRSSPSLSQHDRDNLELADHELARVSQIASQTLRFHRNVNRPGKIEAGTLVHELLILYRTRLAASNIEIRLDLGKHVTFDAFEGDIRQVLNNLISNAFDAMRNGGQLIIRTCCRTDPTTGRKGASIMVLDTGSGIPESARPRIFESFYSTKGLNGTGLGLWISKRIVQRHQGHLHFRTCIGKRHGTAFRMWIPAELARGAADAWV